RTRHARGLGRRAWSQRTRRRDDNGRSADIVATMTSMLNEGISLGSVSADVRAAFTGGAEPQLISKDWKLYKYTQYPLFGSRGVTPWWSSVEPIGPGDPGFAGSLERAHRLGADPARFARARASVTEEWNDMDTLLTAI